MDPQTASLVSNIRAASRDLVRQFGFMSKTLAGTDLSASAVHAIIEVGAGDGVSSKELADRLLLEKSTVSRLVKTLVARDEVREVRSKDDARKKHLHLTAAGRKTLRTINRHAEAQVVGALDRLDECARYGVLKGLRDYSQALRDNAGRAATPGPHAGIGIETGYAPALVGRVLEMLVPYMNGHVGFGAAFEAKVASDLADFVSRLDAPQNQIWRAERDGGILGTIAIDGDTLADGIAQLRWFVVGDEIRGAGAGRALLSRALDFCDERGDDEIHLWTVSGLDAARHLYEENGFELAEEYNGDQWGAVALEQKFVRRRKDLSEPFTLKRSR